MKRVERFLGSAIPAAAVFIVAVVLMTGCPNNPGDVNDEGDGIGPTVVSITPADGSVDVALNTLITVVFDEAVDESTLGSAGIQLIRQGASVPGSVTLDGTGTEATFTPSIDHALYTQFTVQVTAAVRDPDGNALAETSQATFRTVEGRWGDAEKISGSSIYCSDPQAAFEGLDGATAVWSDQTFRGAYDTFAGYYDGASWEAAVKRSSSQNWGASSQPTIASNFNGFSLAAWLQGGDFQTNNTFGSVVSGGSWGEITTISAYDYNDETPVIGVSPGLEEIGFLLWEKNDGEIGDIWSARYDGAWGTSAEVPGMEQFGDEHAPDVAVDPEGNAFAAWIYEGNYSEALASRYDAAAGEWDTNPTVLETGAGVHEYAIVQTACDLEGNAIAIWNISSSNIKARYFDAGTGTWSGTVTIGNAEVCQYPDLAFDAYGNAMAVWFQDGNIYVSRLEAGGWPDWSPANGSPLEAEANASSEYPPQIVLDAEGNGALAYVATVDNSPVVRIKRYRADVDWTDWINDQTEDTFTTFYSINQGVRSLDAAVGPNGRVIAVWDDNGEIKAALFE